LPAALPIIADEIVRCRACPRLVAWREEVAREKRRAYANDVYWGKPVPGFGDRRARLAIIGLAPGAHGANRTGRMFTGDRSGAFLYAALHRRGLASQPTSLRRDDGLTLTDVFITAACRCAPPDNCPERDELSRCAPFLWRELDALPRLHTLLALGAIAWQAAREYLAHRGAEPSRWPPFAHGTGLQAGDLRLIASYHVSQQNTQTGRLTPAMFDRVLRLALRSTGRSDRLSSPARSRF
jgi:uracil-DNA glycosylase family 4